MNGVWRRIVSTAVAILLATSTVFVCAPTTTAASEGHCKPTQRVDAGCHHCPPQGAVDCCASSVPQPSSVPQDTPPQPPTTRSPLNGAALHADAVPALPALQPPAVARTVGRAPLHGFRTIDLPTLNAVFLI